MTGATRLTDQFLIAMPALEDPNFSKTVTYICEHNDEGAMGLVINRPLELCLDEVLKHMDIESPERAGEIRIVLGGPVQQDRGFVVHVAGGDWDSTHEVAADVGITTSRDILSAIADARGPDRSLIALGYAGWGSGQLEQELADNAWLSTPADREILFELPFEERWEAAARLVGVDLRTLSHDVGHA